VWHTGIGSGATGRLSGPSATVRQARRFPGRRAVPARVWRAVIVMAAALVVPVTAVPAAARGPENLLGNPGFEGGHTWVAPGWRAETWGSPAPRRRFAPEDKEVRGGQAQLFQVTAHPERVHLVQRQAFRAGRTYRASIWVKAAEPVDVTLQLRSDDYARDFYQAFLVRTVEVGTGWQLIEAVGTAPRDMDGSFRVFLGGPGTVRLDDARLTDVTAGRTVTRLSPRGPIPADYFGMHLNCRGCYGDTWPGIGFGAWRLWDAGVRWRDLEPAKGRWRFAMMDYLVGSAGKHGVSVIYTLGVAPESAVADRRNGTYGAGSASPPRSLDDWRAYVRKVAERYKGRIHAYEVWNEPDYGKFWNGTPARLAELTRVAAEEIRRADPAAKIISPGITVNGLNWLDKYFAAGAGEHIDVVGGHVYFGLRPETVMTRLANLRILADQHGLRGKPLRVTEGAPLGRPADSDEARGAASRALALLWAYGASGFDWYMWDRHGANVIELAKPGNRRPTQVGVAYRETVSWLRGARMTLHTVHDDGTHVIILNRPGGYVAHMVWNDRGTRSFTVPADWRSVRLRDLSGGSAEAPVRITVGPAPVLLESSGIPSR
jgi:hypothetical protein